MHKRCFRLNTNYYILIEFIVIDTIFLILICTYIRIYKLQIFLDKKNNRKFENDFLKLNNTRKFKVQKIIEKRLQSDRLVFEKEKDFKRYIFFQYILPILILGFILVKLKFESLILLLIPFLYYISNRLKLKQLKKKKHLAFQKNTYKIYKFINNQVSSGVRAHDCIMGLYDVIEDKSFKRVLINMSATYSQTSNIDLSLKSILDVYPGIDAIMLCSAIKQGVYIGSNIETIERQEKLAFNKYFSYIKSETEKIRFKGYLSISTFAFIIVLLIGIPLLYEMKEATTRIFIN